MGHPRAGRQPGSHVTARALPDHAPGFTDPASEPSHGIAGFV